MGVTDGDIFGGVVGVTDGDIFGGVDALVVFCFDLDSKSLHWLHNTSWPR